MATKRYITTKLDSYFTQKIMLSAVVVQGDAYSSLKIQLYSGVLPYNLSSAGDVKLTFTRPDGISIERIATVYDAANGVIVYDLRQEELSQLGYVGVEVNISNPVLKWKGFVFAVKKETAKINAEAVRIANENQRIQSEMDREAQEADRVEAELNRATNNDMVTMAESNRQTSENYRVTYELARRDNETLRQSQETTRQSQESTRQTYESTRQSQESTRQVNESTRQTAETQRQTNYSNVISAYNSAVSSQTNVEVTTARQDGNTNTTYPDLRSRLNVTELAPVIREVIQSGFTKLSGLDYTYMSTNINTIKFLADSIAFVNGFKVTIPTATVLTGTTPPVDVPRDDLVFLEVWLDQTTGAPQNRLRWVSGVDFVNTFGSEGLDLPLSTTNCIVQGGNASVINGTTDTQYRRFINYIGRGALNRPSPGDVGLYVAGDGTSTSITNLKTLDGYVYAIPMFKVHRRPSSGFMETGEYDKISLLSSAMLTKPRTTPAKVSHSGTTGGVSTKIEGRTLVNLLGNAGDCETLAKWGNIGMTLDTSVKLFGSSSFKATGLQSVYQDMLCDQTHKYFVSGYAYISSYTSGNAGITVCDYGNGSSASLAPFDTSKLNQWQRKSQIVTGKANGGMRVYAQAYTAPVITVYFDGIMVYDLTSIFGAGNEPSDISQLERQLPFVNGAKSVLPISIKNTGKNLFNPDFYAKNSAGFTSYANNTLTMANNALNVSTPTDLKLKPGVIYIVSIGGLTNGAPNYRFELSINGTKFIDSGYLIASSVYTFTVPNISSADKITTKFWASNNGTIIVGYGILNPQIEEGSTATTYEAYNESIALIPSEVGELKAIGTVKDTVDLQAGIVTKNISDWVILDGNQAWYSWSLGTGIKNFAFPLPATPAYTSDSTVHNLLTVTNLGTLLNVVNWNSRGLANSITFNSTGTTIISVNNSDSGFVDSYTPSASEIKAYFYGWKMCMSDGSAWDGVATKYWKRITDGTGITATLPTASYAGYTPYKMIYKLATPVIIDIKDKIDGRNYYISGYNTISLEQISRKDGGAVQVPMAVQDDMESTTGWVARGTTTATVTTADKVTGNACINIVTTTSGSAGTNDYARNVTVVSGNKIYACAYIKNNGGALMNVSFVPYNNAQALTNAWQRISGILTAPSTNPGMYLYASGAANFLVDSAFIIDLTALFGVGNEPSQSWCDKYLSFGTNYAIYAPPLTIARRVVNNAGDYLDSVYANVGIIPANKYRSNKLYSLLYRNADGDYCMPDVNVTCGTVTGTINNNAMTGSIAISDTDLSYKKNGDGAIPKTNLTGTYSTTITTLTWGQLVLNTSDYVLLQVDDVLTTGNSNYQMRVCSKDGNSTITVYNMGSSATVNTGWFICRRPDLLLADIIDQRDIEGVNDLRHLVSLNGFDTDRMASDYADRLFRNEL